MYSDRLLTADAPRSDKGAWANTFQALSLAMVATTVPVFAHTAGVPVGASFAIGLALLIAAMAPAAMPVVIVFSFVFQNSVVALITPLIADTQSFTFARSYNFLILATFWGMVTLYRFFGRPTLDAGIDRVLRYSYVVLFLIGIYFVIGALHDPSGATIYLRNIATPLMCLQIGLIIGAQYRPDVLPPFTIIALLVLLYGMLELIFQMDFLRLFHGDGYIRLLQQDGYDSGFWVRQMQETGYVIRDLSDPGTGPLFNYFSDWDIQSHRLLGPNFHPISFTYALSFFVILLVAARRGLVYLLLAIPVLIAAGSKGALVYLVMTLGGLLVARSYRGPGLLLGFILMLGLYAGAAFALALAEGNYHALGFLGGITQFVAQPLGHGLGSSGNLITRLQDVDWSQAQRSGQTDQAVESAVAVLLFQMGIAAFAFLAFLVWLALRCWSDYRRTGSALLAAAAFGLLALCVNGIFQEEAVFAPLALALMTLLAGLELGRLAPARHTEPASSASARSRGPRQEAPAERR